MKRTWDAEQEAWVAQSRDGSIAAEWNPETNSWERILGGSFVSVTSMWNIEGGHEPPPEAQPYLVPTPPEQWDSLRTLPLDDGTPMPWGVLTGLPGTNTEGTSFYATPGLVRAVVPFYESRGGTYYAIVIEFPIPGGSLFYVYPVGTNSNRSQRLWIYPAEGYPADQVGRDITYEEQLQTGFDVISNNEAVALLQRHVGRQLVFLVWTDGRLAPLGKAIVNGQPFPPNVESDYLTIYQQAGE